MTSDWAAAVHHIDRAFDAERYAGQRLAEALYGEGFGIREKLSQAESNLLDALEEIKQAKKYL